jgi:hypothetical protein
MTLPAGVNAVNGDVILDYVPPANVADVSLRKDTVLGHDEVTFTTDQPPLKVIRIETNPLATIEVNGTTYPTFGYLTGQCFYFAVNRLAQDQRGLSDLLPIADFADIHDQMLFNSLERLNHEMSWWWDVMMQGATPDEIKAKADELSKSPPRPGTFNVHNEYVKWSPMASGVQGRNIREDSAVIRNYALGGAGIATYFFSEPDFGGRQMGEAMAAPTYQMMLTRQEEIRDALTLVYRFVLDQKRLRGVLPKTVDTSFEILMPKISLRDFQRTGGAFLRLVQAIDLGVSKNFIHADDGAKIFYALISQLGMGIETLRGIAGQLDEPEGENDPAAADSADSDDNPLPPAADDLDKLPGINSAPPKPGYTDNAARPPRITR